MPFFNERNKAEILTSKCLFWRIFIFIFTHWASACIPQRWLLYSSLMLCSLPEIFTSKKKKHPQSFQVCYIKQAWLHQEVPQSLMSSSGWCSQSWPSSWYPSFCARTDVCEVLTLLQFILQHLCWRRNSSLQDLSLTPSPWSPSVFCCVSFSPSPVSYSSMSRYSVCNLKVFFWRWALNSWKTTQDSLCWEGSMGWRMDLILLLSENIIS